jgi:hypothetical protein
MLGPHEPQKAIRPAGHHLEARLDVLKECQRLLVKVKSVEQVYMLALGVSQGDLEDPLGVAHLEVVYQEGLVGLTQHEDRRPQIRNTPD